MITLNFTFWFLIALFGLIGMMRGWAKELLVSFSLILSLAFITLIEAFLPFIKSLEVDNMARFWVRIVIIAVLVFFGYQTVGMPRFAGKLNREKLQDSLLGFVLGSLNGFLVFGSIWFYMAQANYPFTEYITAPDKGTAIGQAAIAMVAVMPPALLVAPTVYFAVMLCFIFVLVVFI